MGEVQSGEESGLAIGEPAANVRQAFGLEGDRLTDQIHGDVIPPRLSRKHPQEV